MDNATYLAPLQRGAYYTRKQLATLWNHKSHHGLGTGIYTPAGVPLIFIFITAEKTDGITYHDEFDGEILSMDGQNAHLTDQRLISAATSNEHTHLFYRETKRDAFEYFGEIHLESFTLRNEVGVPSRFVYRVASVDEHLSATDAPLIAEIEPLEKTIQRTEFDPTRTSDARVRTQTSIAVRRGQAKFRETLLKAYRGKCTISRCDYPGALEAAHIVPYLGPQTDHIANGLLLRADLHTLFDLGDLWIDPRTYKVCLHTRLRRSSYSSFEGVVLQLPAKKEFKPSKLALATRVPIKRN